MTASKPPTPQAISALLKRAGFERSKIMGGYISGRSNGYEIRQDHVREDAVRVRHHFRSGGNPELWLAKYAAAIEAAGWHVETRDYRAELIVTAGRYAQDGKETK